MMPPQREYWAQTIKELAVTWGLGAASPQEIDLLGIVPATRLASMRAVDALDVCPDCLLLDYIKLPEISVAQVSIPKGDMVSLSVAAASVLAKTTRDAILVSLEEKHPGYGFANHKGYGTAVHLQALERMGPSPVHRYSFAPVRSGGKH
jgi:ribonuclease HII